MKKFHFWVKFAVFNENENEILKILIFAAHGVMLIFNKWSKLKNDLFNRYSRRYGILKSYPIGIRLFCIEMIDPYPK